MSYLPRFLCTSTAKTFRSRTIFWFSLSLAVAAFFGFQSLQYAFSSPYVVQDDFRQHGFWMQRFSDPELFPNDLIADYFQSVAPPGYTTLYRLMAAVGIEPLFLSKLLPMLLDLITTGYIFGVCLQIFAVPVAGFISTLVLNQSIWLEDDVVSATQRAFVYPLFSAFLYYLLRRSWLLGSIAIALMGLFYPHIALLSVGILTLRLCRWQGKYPQLSKDRTDYLFWMVGLVVTALVLLPYELTPNEFGPLVTVAQARMQPEFREVEGVFGRAFFFDENPFIYWLVGSRSGIIFLGVMSPLILAAFALPFLLRQPSRFPKAWQVRKVGLLTQIVLASLGLYFLAHALLFRLHFPSRYVYHSLRIVLALAAGIALTLWLEPLRSLKQHVKTGSTRQFLLLVLGGVLAIAPFFPQITLPNQLQVVGTPQLYEFLLKQPKDTLIASVAEEANNLPIFAARPILVGRETALPYHTRYYAQIRQRVIDLIDAHYSPELEPVQRFIQKYGVDFFLLDANAFTPSYLAQNDWLHQFQPATTQAIQRLQRGEVPALSKLVEHCSVLKTNRLILVQAKCVYQFGGIPHPPERGGDG